MKSATHEDSVCPLLNLQKPRRGSGDRGYTRCVKQMNVDTGCLCTSACSAYSCCFSCLISSLQLLGLPDADDDAFEEYSADMEEEEPEADHPQMGVSQQ